MKRDGNNLFTTECQVINIGSPAAERCDCPPLSSLHRTFGSDPDNAGEGEDTLTPVTPATRELNRYLRSSLAALFPRSTPLSLLLIHVSQLEHVHIMPKTAILHKRHRYHAPGSFMEQVLINVRRTMRSSDQLILHGGTGAAIILPDVDEEGAFGIVERVYYSINLLQPETVIPPLKRETDISIGIGSYPRPGTSPEELLYHAGCVAHNLTLRPAFSEQIRSSKPSYPVEIHLRSSLDDEFNSIPVALHASGVPYMRLPSRLSQSLKRLIPYKLACELRCVPVGRDHNRLTVAMAHPTDTHAIHLLQTTTSMIIFPVACEATTLDSMLSRGW
ncbi:MAG TPA: diguanylate cyclase [Ktedonobacteraceae bacterium]|nr:diguanylate cyclase [Ktedonobacteraceae bacterium]